MTFTPKFTPEEQTINRIEKYFRLRAAGRITGRELVDTLLMHLVHDGDFERVAAVTRKLMTQDSVDVADWLEWIEPQYNDPRWTPFWPGNRNGHLEHHRKAREDFRRAAEIVRSIIKEYRPDTECEEIQDV
jgi:hypothetical protein